LSLALAVAFFSRGVAPATAASDVGSRETIAGDERDELVPDSVVYAAAKAAAAKAAASRATVQARPVLPSSALGVLPTILARFEGIYDPSTGNPDETSAIGPTRLVEVVNNRLGIFDRQGTLLAGGSIAELTGADPNDFSTDPQILWDPSSRRFYYTIYLNRNHAACCDPGIAWGFSTTASPSSLADFCGYFTRFDYGGTFPDGTFPDFPQLGTTQDFLLIGINRFTFRTAFVGADLAWISKPPPGSTCPAPSSFHTGIFEQLKNVDGSLAFTPIPARQVDAAPTGRVVSGLFPGGNYLNVYTVQRDPGTGAALLSAPARLDVPSYSMPADAPQAGTTTTGQPAPLLDTGAGKLTQAYAAFDPRLGHVAVWTTQTAFGGAGAEVRWYEIDPSGPRLDQSGVVTDPQFRTYFYYGSIAPDRAVEGTSSAFGSNMVLGFDQSSTTTDVQIAMVSKVGAAAQSAPVVVKTSPGPNVTGASPNRWGDYSGASPDPTPVTTTTGVVWLTNQWNIASTGDGDPDWRTWNWAATAPDLTDVPSGGAPMRFRVFAPHPNPSGDGMQVDFELPGEQKVMAEVFDMRGRLARTIASWQEYPAGRHSLRWDSRNDAGAPAPPGIYFIQVRARGLSSTRKVAVLR